MNARGTMRLISAALSCSALTWMLSCSALAETAPRFQPIPKERWPALLYVQEDIDCDPPDRSSLMIATFDRDEPALQKVMTSQYVKGVQLGDATFLLEADNYPKDRSQWTQHHFLVNFETGAHVLLGRSRSRDKLVHHWCLRSVPDRNKAVILRYGQGTTENTLIDVDLTTLKTTTRHTFPRNDATAGFHGPHMEISPDFRLLAAMVGRDTGGPRTVSLRSRFSLRVLDLETMKAVTLDDKVEVEIGPTSSHGGGRPPYEWVDDRRILYLHMIPADAEESEWRTEADCVLKCVNVRSKTTREWARKRLRLTLGGGYMGRDWLTGELRYGDFTVDTRKRALVPYRPCYSVKRGSGRTEIRFRGQILYQQEGRRYAPSAWGCVSRSQEHFAHFVRFDNGAGTPTVYAKTRDMEQPVRVAEVPFYTTLVAWIEDTSGLRKD